MITVSVPSQDVADAVGDLGEDVHLVVWNPADGDPPAAADDIRLACLAHGTGGRTVYSRLALLAEPRGDPDPVGGLRARAAFRARGRRARERARCHDTRTAEMALTLTLASQRALPQFLDAQRRGRWEPWGLAPSLADKRVLIVGYGSIGSAIGSRMRACEALVDGVARSARTAPDGTAVHAIDDVLSLLPEYDIVVLVTPHDDSTDKLADAAFLGAMRDGALLVNVGRGAVVDTDALLPELTTGRLRAALDVTDPEPLPDDHPLFSAPGCIVVPHVAGFAQLTDRRYVDLVHRQVASLRAGEGGVNRVA